MTLAIYCEYVCVGVCLHVHTLSSSVVSNLVTLRTLARQVPLSMEISRQEYWSGLLFLLQGVFPSQGSNPCLLHLLHCRWILYHYVSWEAHTLQIFVLNETTQNQRAAL